MRWRWGFVAAACVVHASTAHAERVADPQTDFAFEIDAREDRICVFVPAKRGNCKGLDPDALRAQLSRSLELANFVFGAVVRAAGWRYTVVLLRQPAMSEAKDEDLATIVSAFNGGVAHGERGLPFSGAPASTAHASRVNGVQVVDFSMLGDATIDAGVVNMYTAVRVLFGRQASYFLEFFAEKSHSEALEDVMARALMTLKLEPALPASPAPRSVLSIARDVLLAIAALAVGVWGASWWLGRRETKSKPSKKKQRAKSKRTLRSATRVAATLCGVSAIGAYMANAFLPGHSPLFWQLLESFLGVGGIVATVYGIRGRLGPDAAKPEYPKASP